MSHLSAHLHVQGCQQVENPPSCPVCSAHDFPLSHVLLLLQVSAADYIQQPKQHSAEDQWRPAEIAVPANKRTLQPEEHCTAPKASFEQTEDEQVGLKH